MINKEYKDVIKAAKAGGAITKKYFGKVLELEGKSTPADFRTKADLESEKAIIKILSKKFPTYNIVSEEAGEINKNSEYTFIIDPLDGTNNFVLGMPYFSTCIGLMKGDTTIFGVVYNPILKNIYFAEKGKGAYLNGKRISVNKNASLEESSLSYVGSYKVPIAHSPESMSKLYHKCKRVLNNWSVLLDFCLLASGKIEAVTLVSDVCLHDYVAGKLIAKEAGAMITDLNGDPEINDKNCISLSTNGTAIHNEILEILNK